MEESESYVSDFELPDKQSNGNSKNSPLPTKSNAKLLADIPEIESRRTMLTNHTTMSNYYSMTGNSPTLRYQKNIMRLSNAF